jgi:5-hydroxyisourate hydrolase
MGRLTTHVLDTVRGRPGKGIKIKLFALESGRHLVASAVTNAEGRTAEPLLNGETFEGGSYEIEFLVGEYFRGMGVDTGEPPFLDEIIVRVSLAAEGNYHVPLLVSPWSYSTYRGS